MVCIWCGCELSRAGEAQLVPWEELPWDWPEGLDAWECTDQVECGDEMLAQFRERQRDSGAANPRKYRRVETVPVRDGLL